MSAVKRLPREAHCTDSAPCRQSWPSCPRKPSIDAECGLCYTRTKSCFNRYYSGPGAGHLHLRLLTKSVELISAVHGVQVPGT